MKETLVMPFQKTDAYLVAKMLAKCVHDATIKNAGLRDQVDRASQSAFLQVAEGLPNASRAMRRKYFTCARNSACEVAAAVDLAADIGAMSEADAEVVATNAARLSAILYGLLR